ncbi:MAG: hypothetical protein IT581_02915 [Verrucomicrobiales bacterium]|nr:hypothetical protein [Verrucomicrobiales bacterium]
MAETMWTSKDATGDWATSNLRPIVGETGLELTADTVIEFAADQQAVELRFVVAEGGATLAVESYASGGGAFASLPPTVYPAGAHDLLLDDACRPGDCGYTLRRVRVRLTSGPAIVTQVGTQYLEE